MAIKYSKKIKQSTINENCEAPVYDGSKQSWDPRFWSLFHSDWYHSFYLHKKKPVVEIKWVNWDWMATRRHTIFNQIKATCNELEMTKMMSFKYDWNKKIICQFYATLYFETNRQKLMWMTDGQRYETTVCVFVRLLGLEHQLTIELEAQIHTFEVLKLDEMQFIYAPGVKAHPPKVQNFLPELNTLHRLLRATLTLRIRDATSCPQYERNLIQFYVQKKPFCMFSFMLAEIVSISRNVFHSCGYAP
jgi:hypothetical protein